MDEELDLYLDTPEPQYAIALTRSARSALVPLLEEALERQFDVSDCEWTFSPKEARKLINEWAIL